ncbi:isoleucine--tRNA ligase, cytoplasmic, partial [Tanacetum coccineum]
MDDVIEGKDFSFPKQEEKILEWWTEVKAFETQLEKTKDLQEYIFYDGPPFATGLPHYGHILAGTIKDVVTSIVLGYVGEVGEGDLLEKGGDGIDFKNDYKTMDLNFMESVWWVFSELFKKDLVYRGFKVMPYSTGLKTPLSNFEANSNYKDVSDPEVMVTFPILDAEDGAAIVAWTTTPWTLPSNLALCVNSEFVYVKVKRKSNGNIYVVAESRLSELPVEKPKKGTPSGPVDGNSLPKTKGSTGGKAKNTVAAYEILEKFPGSSLVGKKYVPLFDYFKDFTDTAFRVVSDGYVTSDSGTGIVHCAPAFGEDDYR